MTTSAPLLTPGEAEPPKAPEIRFRPAAALFEPVIMRRAAVQAFIMQEKSLRDHEPF